MQQNRKRARPRYFTPRSRVEHANSVHRTPEAGIERTISKPSEEPTPRVRFDAVKATKLSQMMGPKRGLVLVRTRSEKKNSRQFLVVIFFFVVIFVIILVVI